MTSPQDHGHAPFTRAMGDITNIENPMTTSEEGLKPFPHTSAFVDDDGATPQPLELAYSQDPPNRIGAVVEALRGVRVLIPVVANVEEMEEPEYEGQVVGDKRSHAAMVTVETPDGRAALPVFSSTQAMAAWRQDARPVPVEAPKAALAAGTEADSLLVLDPGGPQATLIPSQAVAAIATGQEWTNPLLDAHVHTAIAEIVDAIPNAVQAEVLPGQTSQIRIVLALRPGLDRVGVVNATNQMSAALGSTPVITEKIDSLELRITTAKTQSD